MISQIDRLEVNGRNPRVCGPFTTEAAIMSSGRWSVVGDQNEDSPLNTARDYLDPMIEVLRRSKTLKRAVNVSLELETVRP